MLALTVLLQGCMWRAALASRQHIPAAIAASATTVVLALLPEALYWRMHVRDNLRDGRTQRAGDQLDNETEQGIVHLVIGGMGCTACTAKVKAAIEAIDGVSACAVDFESGRASVVLATAAPASLTPSVSTAFARTGAAIQREALAAVRKAGFSPEAEDRILPEAFPA